MGGWKAHCEGIIESRMIYPVFCVSLMSKINLKSICAYLKTWFDLIFIEFHSFIEADIKLTKLTISRD